VERVNAISSAQLQDFDWQLKVRVLLSWCLKEEFHNAEVTIRVVPLGLHVLEHGSIFVGVRKAHS